MEGSENRIAEVRAAKGLKQTELAARLDLSRGQIANIESGARKVDLPELRRIARVLGCDVVELLLPQDAPNQPEESETALIKELRALDGYDPRAILSAARAVVEAARGVTAVQRVPRSLSGDPVLARELVDRWDGMDDGGRKKALQLLDSARAFGS